MTINKGYLMAKLTSRKFWVSFCGFVSGLVMTFNGSESTANTISGLIMQAASVFGYLVAEGLTDSARVDAPFDVHFDKKFFIKKLESRKLWTAIAGLVSGIILATKGDATVAEQVSGAIMQAASVIGYLIAESSSDIGSAKSAKENTSTDSAKDIITEG
jgi:drug/metabolite transporter (DMT)-like permease